MSSYRLTLRDRIATWIIAYAVKRVATPRVGALIEDVMEKGLAVRAEVLAMEIHACIKADRPHT